MEDTLQDTELDTQEDQQSQPPKKIKVSEFAAKIKAKYPEYKDIDDDVLTQKIIDKYPVYKETVDIPVPIKKKDDGTPVSSPTQSSSPLPADDKVQPQQVDISGVNIDDTPQGNEPTNIIDRALYADQLRNKKKEVVNDDLRNNSDITKEVPDDEAIAYADKIKKDIKDKTGLDTDELASDFKDYPKEAFDSQHELSKDDLIKLRQTNPIAYRQILNETKNHYAVKDAAKQEALDNGKDLGDKNTNEQIGRIASNDYIGTTDADLNVNDLNGLYNVIGKKQAILQAHLSGDELAKANDRLKQTYYSFINPSNPDLQKEYEQSPLKSKIDQLQYAGLKTMQLFEPEKYDQAVAILNQDIKPLYHIPNLQVSRDDSQAVNTTDSAFAMANKGKLSDLTVNQQIAKEKVLKDLADAGRTNTFTQITSHQHDLEDQYKNTTDPAAQADIAQRYKANQDTLNGIVEDAKADDQKYPLTTKLKFDNIAKEVTQQSGHNMLGFGWNRFGKGWSNTVDATEDALTGLFGSKEDNTKLQMKRIGEGQNENADMYLPENLRTTGSPFILQASQKLKDGVKQLTGDKSVSDWTPDDKQKVNDYLQKNQGEIQTITNPEAGKSKNFFSKAAGFQVAGFTGDVASFMSQVGALKGIGLGAKAAEMTTLFNGAYAENFNKATEEGMSPANAHAYGMLHGGVMMLAGLISSKYDNVKKILGESNSPLSKQIAGLGEEKWDAIVNGAPSISNKVAKAAKSLLVDNAKNIGTYGVGASIANDLVDKGFFNKNISTDEMVDHAVQSAKDMAVGSVALAGAGFLSHILKSPVTVADKAAMWDIGDNPDINKAKIDEAVTKGDISTQEGELRKKAVDNVAGLINKVPTVTDKGKPLTDQQRVDYLYNSIVSSKSKEAAKELPPKQAEKAEMTGLVAEHQNAILLDNPTDTQLQTRKNQLEKLLIPEKDEAGKEIPINEKLKKETEAELEAVNDVIDKRSVATADNNVKRIVDTKLSVPILPEQTDPNFEDKYRNNIPTLKGASDADINDHAKENATDDPAPFIEKYGRDKFDELVKDIPTEDLQGKLDMLLKVNPDNKGVDILDKIISDREKVNTQSNETGSKSTVKIISDKSKLEDNVLETLKTYGIDYQYNKAQTGSVYIYTDGGVIRIADHPENTNKRIPSDYEISDVNQLGDIIPKIKEAVDSKIKIEKVGNILRPLGIKDEKLNVEVISEGKDLYGKKEYTLKRLSDGKEYKRTSLKTFELVKSVEEALGTKNETKENKVPISTEKEGTTDTGVTKIEPAAEEGEGEENNNTTGVRHETLQKLAKRLELEPAAKGTFLSTAEQTARGRELLRGGADPFRVAKEFKENGTVNADNISVARAYFEHLTKETQAAMDKFGKNSKEFKEAKIKMQQWQDDVVKPMGTVAGASLSSLKGETDLDTGSYIATERAVEEITGKPVNTEQAKKIEELTSATKELNKKLEDLQKKFTDNIDKNITKPVNKKQEAAQRTADALKAFRKASGLSSGGLEALPEFVEVIKALVNEGVVNLKDVIERFRSEFPNAKVSDEAIKNQFDNATSKDIVTKFADKKDNNFSLEEVKEIWKYAKDNYVDKGSTVPEMLNGVATDLGLKFEQVLKALEQPKGSKEISNHMFLLQNRRTAVSNKVKEYVNTANTPKAVKLLKAIPNFFFQKAVFGHGTVGMITHAGMNIFRPTIAKIYWKSFLSQFKNSFGGLSKSGLADYEKRMDAMKADPMYVVAKRAGVKVDPTSSNDDYQPIRKFFGRLSLAGDRGFNALKEFRLAYFKNEYNRLSDAEKADPETLKEIAKTINHATGTSDFNPSPALSTAVFAPRLEASKWARIVTDPAKALITLGRWNKATLGEKAAAKLVLKKNAEILATYVTGLAINQALLSATGSQQSINFTDPTKKDWLKFKVGGENVDLSGGIASTLGFIGHVLTIPFMSKSDLHGKSKADELMKTGFDYGTSKASPFASTVMDAIRSHDFMGNTMPWSDDKPVHKYNHKLTWKEYIFNNQLPIPAAEASRSIYESLEKRGMSPLQIEDFLTAIAKGVVSGGTGAKVSTDFSTEQKTDNSKITHKK